MCTVSLIAVDDTLRLVCNRDELRTRPAALPPCVVSGGDVQAIMPIDPESDGTWVAGTDAGLAFALLNVAEAIDDSSLRAAAGGDPLRSRGEIIPALIRCRSLDEVLDAVLAIPPQRYRPYRLVVGTRSAAVEIRPERRDRPARQWALSRPLMFTSSGLGDHLVERPRRALFERMMVGGRELARQQDRFHRHCWPSRPHLSVRMRRPDACTVSRTVVEISHRKVALTYRGENGKASVAHLVHRADRSR